MNEIICPRCSSTNSSDQENCWLCGTSLKSEQEGAQDPPDFPSSEPAPNEEAAPAVPNEDLPDWLASLRSETEPSRPPVQSENDLPDWLRAFQQPESEAREETEQAADADDNSWLREFAAWAGETPPPEPEPEPEAPVVNWDARLGTGPLTEDLPEELSAPESDSAEYGTGSEPAPEPGSSIEKSTPQEQPYVFDTIKPDWLGEAVEPPVFSPQDEDEGTPALQQPEGKPSTSQEDWQAPSETPAAPENGTAIGSLDDVLKEDESLNWLGVQAAAAASLQRLTPEDEMDGLARADRLPDQLEADASSGSPLEPAAMPGWLQAIHPDGPQTTALSTRGEDTAAELEGPLAGIRGILPSKDIIAAYLPTEPYAAGLLVSDSQRAHAAILESLVAEEAIPQPAVRVRKARPVQLFRVLLSLLVVGVLSVVLLTGFPITPQPEFFAPSLVSFQNTVDGLGAQNAAPLVLVVVDYQPGTAAELESVAAGPLRDLVTRNASVILISSQASGPLLAERLTEAMVNWDEDSSTIQTTVNLGYLAGGASGVQAFVSDPRQAAPANFNPDDRNLSPWAQPPLDEVEALVDFSAIMVLTDSLEGGQVWIEQTSLAPERRPLLMVSSAQSGPMLQPYVQSGQASGLVSGLGGGVQYNLLSQGTPGIDLRAWSAYQIGLGLAAVLTLLGGLIQGLLTIFWRGKES